MIYKKKVDIKITLSIARCSSDGSIKDCRKELILQIKQLVWSNVMTFMLYVHL